MSLRAQEDGAIPVIRVDAGGQPMRMAHATGRPDERGPRSSRRAPRNAWIGKEDASPDEHGALRVGRFLSPVTNHQFVSPKATLRHRRRWEVMG